MDLIKRPRRLRENEILRNMAKETKISKNSLIYPIFVKEGKNIKEEIISMKGQYRYSLDTLLYEIEALQEAGIKSILLFGIPDKKDECGSEAYNEKGIVQKAVKLIKKKFPKMYVITDVCLCEYTSHGHCGILNGQCVDNDKTLKILAKTALSHVEAGADMIAPSDMMDGRIGAIRKKLDNNEYTNIPIMAYSAKYASAFYGPFREAAASTPSFGNRKGYQMDYHNKKEAIKEIMLDIEEGADIVMVKPALAYLDIINEASKVCNNPICAYSVSGEYSMIKSAAQNGFIDEEEIICETATSIFRAGADILITYYAKELVQFIDEGRI